MEGPARELKSVTTHEEQAEFGGHLLLAMAGRPPAKLIDLTRGLLPRLKEAPEPVRKNLDTWLKRVCSADQSLRFGTLFDLLVTAQLPGFRTHLHCLHLCEVPDSCLPAVQDAWEEWHIEAPWLEVPDDVPEILSRLVSVEYGLSLAQTLALGDGLRTEGRTE